MLSFDGEYFHSLKNFFYEVSTDFADFNNLLKNINLELHILNHNYKLDLYESNIAKIESKNDLFCMKYDKYDKNIYSLLNKDILVIHDEEIPLSIANKPDSKWPPLDIFIDLLKKNDKTKLYFWKTIDSDIEILKTSLYNRVTEKELKNAYFGKIHPFLTEHFFDLKNGIVHDNLINPQIYYQDRKLKRK